MILIARTVGWLLLGAVLGSAITAAFLGRFEVRTTSSGQLPFGFVIRTDRFTGEVDATVWTIRDQWSAPQTLFHQ